MKSVTVICHCCGRGIDRGRKGTDGTDAVMDALDLALSVGAITFQQHREANDALEDLADRGRELCVTCEPEGRCRDATCGVPVAADEAKETASTLGSGAVNQSFIGGVPVAATAPETAPSGRASCALAGWLAAADELEAPYGEDVFSPMTVAEVKLAVEAMNREVPHASERMHAAWARHWADVLRVSPYTARPEPSPAPGSGAPSGAATADADTVRAAIHALHEHPIFGPPTPTTLLAADALESLDRLVATLAAVDGDGTPAGRMRWFWERIEPHRAEVDRLVPGYSIVCSRKTWEQAFVEAFEALLVERDAAVAALAAAEAERDEAARQRQARTTELVRALYPHLDEGGLSEMLAHAAAMCEREEARAAAAVAALAAAKRERDDLGPLFVRDVCRAVGVDENDPLRMDKALAALAETEHALAKAQVGHEGQRRLQEHQWRRANRLDGVRVAALECVAAVLEQLGDDTPSVLFDAHRYLATGRTDDEARLLGGVG